jgi:V8-like Glu-specific endopeptidase
LLPTHLTPMDQVIPPEQKLPTVLAQQLPPLSSGQLLLADGRYRNSNTTGYPYRAIGQLEFTKPGGQFICSGSLISENLVLTAAHCVYETKGSKVCGWWSTCVY